MNIFKKIQNIFTKEGNMSDGYHTFDELYHYRALYNAAFFNELAHITYTNSAFGCAQFGAPRYNVHKSLRHSTGEKCFGGDWFIVVADLPTGQISNHYPMKYWNLFDIEERLFAAEWDGHTPQEAADRLEKYLSQISRTTYHGEIF